MEVLKRIFLLQNVPDLRPRYNIAPTQEIPVVEEAKSTNERSIVSYTPPSNPFTQFPYEAETDINIHL